MAPIFFNIGPFLRKVITPLLLAVSFLLIFVNQVVPSVSDKARMYVADCFSPFWHIILQARIHTAHLIQEASDVKKTAQENHALKQENDNLRQWYETSLNLIRENALLKTQLHYLPLHYTTFVTGPVIADNGGNYARALLINGGRANGIEIGNLALTPTGLAGRVLQTGEHSSRILLVTDTTSRIPVYLLSSHKEAIMAGDNSPYPHLLYYAKETPPLEGETIETDNQPGIQSGIPIGQVFYTKGNATPFVRLFAPLDRLEILRIYQFSRPQPLPNDHPQPAPKGHNINGHSTNNDSKVSRKNS